MPLLQQSGENPTGLQTWVIFFGTLAAFITFLYTSYHHDRAERAANGLAALQTLRTDKDYLSRAKQVRDMLGGDFSRPAGAELISYLCSGAPTQDPQLKDMRDFVEAVDFMLNQYEFIAAAARLGAIDTELLRQTIRSTTLNLSTAFEAYIQYERRKHPRIWANMAWMASEFDPVNWPMYRGRLGPIPDFN